MKHTDETTRGCWSKALLDLHREEVLPHLEPVLASGVTGDCAEDSAEMFRGRGGSVVPL